MFIFTHAWSRRAGPAIDRLCLTSLVLLLVGLSACSGAIVKSSVWQAVKQLSALACQQPPPHLQI